MRDVANGVYYGTEWVLLAESDRLYWLRTNVGQCCRVVRIMLKSDYIDDDSRDSAAIKKARRILRG